MTKRAKQKAPKSVHHRCVHCGYDWYSMDPPGEYACGACDELTKANADELNADSIERWANRLFYTRDDQPCVYAEELIRGLCLALESRLSKLSQPMTDADVHEAFRQHITTEH